ncbi:MAG: hypothetical protein HY323_15280 [Betaproteobacteria bacterium]|nr:hypothetical protein [Betaproteobacteria bacterium]
MRIRAIRETAVPLKADLRNAAFDFSEMTTSVVAVITDVVRDGKPVAGFAFNSTGRYACGAQIRDRFIPRILAARPESLVNGAGGNLDPEKVLACMMQREKPGGHSERSIAIGTIEVACWDAVAKIEEKPLHRVLAEIAAVYDAPLATGENLFSTQDVQNLIRLGGLRAERDVIQTDVPQSYGIVQFSRTLEMAARAGWRRSAFFPHGGNQMTLHVTGGFGLGGCESYPGVFGVFAGFADDAKVENGCLKLPSRPGIGFEAQNALYAVMRELAGRA